MVQTKDNVSVDVDSVICWHVISPYRAAFGINDVRTALVERARTSPAQFTLFVLISETTLRQVVGGRVLQSVISDREGLAQEVAEIVCSLVLAVLERETYIRSKQQPRNGESQSSRSCLKTSTSLLNYNNPFHPLLLRSELVNLRLSLPGPRSTLLSS